MICELCGEDRSYCKCCFGRSWDANAVQCTGGPDPAYLDENGSNVRSRCKLYAKCATMTVKNQTTRKDQQQQQVRPVMQTPIHSVVAGITQGAATVLARQQAAQQAVVKPVMQQPQPMVPQPYYGYPQPVMVHPMMAQAPYTVPMNYQQPGMQMPAYLTVPEPVLADQHWFWRLMWNIGRSMVKAGAHTTANFVDHTPVNPYQLPPPADPQQQG